MKHSLNLTLSEFVYNQYLPAKKHTDSTEKYQQRESEVQNAILPYLGHIPVNMICEDDIIRWQNKLLSSNKTTTYIRESQKLLKTIFTYAKRECGLSYDPSSKAFATFSTPGAKSKIEERRLQIISVLLQGNISYQELKNNLNITEGTCKKDIEALRKQYGYHIESHKGILSLKKNEMQYEQPIDAKDAELFDLLMRMGIEPVTLVDICKKIPAYERCPGKYQPAIRTSVRKSLNKLKSLSLIQYQKNGYLYKNDSGAYLLTFPEDTGKVLSFILFCILNHYTSNKLYTDFTNYLSTRSRNFLIPITNKESIKKHIINHAKQHSTLDNLPYYIEKLCNVNYQNDALSFYYGTGKNKMRLVTFFYVGMLIYSKEKDILYLLGYERPTKKAYKVCRADRIDWNTLKSAGDKNFQNKLLDKKYRKEVKNDFEQIQTEMFDVSLDSKEDIEILFDYTPDIDLELSYLKSKRRTVSITYITNTKKSYPAKHLIPTAENITNILYRDTIRGLGDFVNYLRKFGDRITVLKNENLKNQIKLSAEQVLKNYTESENTSYGAK